MFIYLYLPIMTSCETPTAIPPTSCYQIVSFGDSLSDVGTYAPAAAHFGGGRFTTNPGEVWTQVLARSYGDVLYAAYIGGFGTPLMANSGGFGYAHGGARIKHPVPFSGNTMLYDMLDEVNTTSPMQALQNAHKEIQQEEENSAENTDLSSTSIADQIRHYLEIHHGFTASQLVLINGGGNDIMANASAAAIGKISFPSAIEAIKTAALQYAELIQSVFENGAQNFLVSNIPDLGNTPIGITDIETSTVLTQLCVLFNTTFMQSLEISLPKGHSIVFVDTFDFMNKTLQAYQEYGFSVGNTGIACKLELLPDYARSALFSSPAIYKEPRADQTYMFADSVHPSSSLHALFAKHSKAKFEAHLAQRAQLESSSRAA